MFAVDDLSSITFNRQTTVAGPLSPVPVSLSMVRAVPGAVATVAFGKYLSPDYQVHPGQYIPPVGNAHGQSGRSVHERDLLQSLPSFWS